MIFGGVFVMLSVFSGLGEADADFDADADADMDLGLDADADADADFDVDADADADADLDADLDADADLDGGFDPEADLDGADPGAGEFDVSEVPFEFDLEAIGVETAESSGGSVDVETGPRKSFNPLFSFKFWTFGLAFFGLTGFVFEQFGIWGSSLGVLFVSLVMGLFAGLSVSYGLRAVDTSDSSALSERDYLGASAEVLLPIEEGNTGKVRMNLDGHTVDRLATAFEEGATFERGDMVFVLGYTEQEGVEVVDTETVRRQVVGSEERRTLEDFEEEMAEEQEQQHVSEKNA